MEFAAFIVYVARPRRRVDVALRPSVNVVFSLQKKEHERKRRVKRRGTNEERRTERTAKVNRSRLLIGTSQLPAGSLTRISYVPFHPSFLPFLQPLSLSLSLSIPFSSVLLPRRLLALLLSFPTLTLAEMYPVGGKHRRQGRY